MNTSNIRFTVIFCLKMHNFLIFEKFWYHLLLGSTAIWQFLTVNLYSSMLYPCEFLVPLLILHQIKKNGSKPHTFLYILAYLHKNWTVMNYFNRSFSFWERSMFWLGKRCHHLLVFSSNPAIVDHEILPWKILYT